MLQSVVRRYVGSKLKEKMLALESGSVDVVNTRG
jgi:hypothetical protein